MPRPLRFPRSFAFRLDEANAARLAEVAFAYGYRPAEWARKIVEEEIGCTFAQRSVQSRVLHADLLRQYLVELNRQGNNLNQIAAKLNSDQNPDAASARIGLEAIRAKNRILVESIVAALGGTESP